MKRIATSLAALGLAAAGIVGLGGTAHATAYFQCSGQLWSDYAAEYQICVVGTVGSEATVKWAVNPTYAKTDERFWLIINDACGDSYGINWNDQTQSSENVNQISFSCDPGALSARMYPTESGNNSGPLAAA